MQPELPDIVYDAAYNVRTIIEERVPRNLRRLKRYPVFYRRLRSRNRFGTLLYRVAAVALLDYGGLLGLAAVLWGVVVQKFRRQKAPPAGT